MDTTTAYHETRLRISGLLRGLDDEAARATVPCCPDWTVADLAAHVAGVAADVIGGQLDGVGTNPWTAAQVAARQGRSLAEIVDEWDTAGAALEAALPDGAAPAQLVFDTVTHEHDLRHAIGRTGAHDHAAVTIGLGFVVDTWPLAVAGHGVPALRIEADDLVLAAGDDPEVTLHLTPFEALRGLTGRRSLEQVRAWNWGTDPTPWLGAFTWGPFTPTTIDIDETATTWPRPARRVPPDPGNPGPGGGRRSRATRAEGQLASSAGSARMKVQARAPITAPAIGASQKSQSGGM